MLDVHFVYLGAAIGAIGQVGYVVDTIRGRTQPNRVTWLLWALAPLLACRHSPATKSPKRWYISVNLRNLHGAAFRDRLERRLREHQRSPSVVETNNRGLMRFDSFDKSVDLRIKRLSVALGEKVKQGRSVIAETLA